MTTPATLFLGLLALVFLVAPTRADDEPVQAAEESYWADDGGTWTSADMDLKLQKQISEILTECEKIKVGMTRAELMKVFTTEGGIYTKTERTYVHPRCRYIKVRVEFTLSDPKQQERRPTDTVKKISRPFLEWRIFD